MLPDFWGRWMCSDVCKASSSRWVNKAYKQTNSQKKNESTNKQTEKEEEHVMFRSSVKTTRVRIQDG